MDDRIKTILSQVLNIDIQEISEEFSKETTEKWDSVRHMMLILALEEEFGIEIRDDQISQLHSLKSIRMLLKNSDLK